MEQRGVWKYRGIENGNIVGEILEKTYVNKLFIFFLYTFYSN